MPVLILCIDFHGLKKQYTSIGDDIRLIEVQYFDLMFYHENMTELNIIIINL